MKSGHGEKSVVTNVSIVNKLFHQKLMIEPNKYMLQTEHNGTLESFNNMHIISIFTNQFSLDNKICWTTVSV